MSDTTPSRKPIATVEPNVITSAGGIGAVRLSGPGQPSWGASGDMWERDNDPAPHLVAEHLAADINAAHFAAVDQLRGQLARARQAILDLEAYGPTCDASVAMGIEAARAECKCLRHAAYRLINSIDSDDRFYTLAEAKEWAAVECDRLLESDERFRAAAEKARAEGYAEGQRAPRIARMDSSGRVEMSFDEAYRRGVTNIVTNESGDE